jgi:hypothetical protein
MLGGALKALTEARPSSPRRTKPLRDNSEGRKIRASYDVYPSSVHRVRPLIFCNS